MKKFLLGILALSMLCTACKKDKDEEASLDKSQIVGKWKITKVTSSLTVTGLPAGMDFDATALNDFDAVEKDQIYEFKADGSISVDNVNGDILPPVSYTIDGKYLVLIDANNDPIKFAASLNGSTLTLTLGAEDLKTQIKEQMKGQVDEFVLNMILNAIGGKVEIIATKQ